MYLLEQPVRYAGVGAVFLRMGRDTRGTYGVMHPCTTSGECASRIQQFVKNGEVAPVRNRHKISGQMRLTSTPVKVPVGADHGRKFGAAICNRQALGRHWTAHRDLRTDKSPTSSARQSHRQDRDDRFRRLSSHEISGARRRSLSGKFRPNMLGVILGSFTLLNRHMVPIHIRNFSQNDQDTDTTERRCIAGSDGRQANLSTSRCRACRPARASRRD